MSWTSFALGWSAILLAPFVLVGLAASIERLGRRWWSERQEHPAREARRSARRIRRVASETERAVERIQRAAR